MRKIWLWLFIIVFLAFSAEAKQRSFQGLTGTGTYPAVANLALDGWPVAGDAGPPIVTALAQGDFSHGHDNAGNYYTYVYNAASSAAEDVPDVITPNDSAGAGRWIRLGLGIIETLQMTPTTGIAHSEGLFYYDSTLKTFVFFNEEPDVSLQIGQEGWIRVYNDTGGDIADGKVCYLSGETTGGLTVDLAIANDATKCLGTIGWATHTIEDGTWGYITRWGLLNNQDTLGETTVSKLWLSSTSEGDYTTTPPTSPSYLIGVGTMGIISETVGTIDVTVSIGTNTAGVIKIFNGAVLEDTATSVASTGGVVTLSYEQSGTGDLSLFFNGGFEAFDTTPAATIVLTEGSDISPTLNYVYIPESTMILTVSTVGFPSEQHVPVATALVQDGLSVETDGLYKLHAWTDHLSDSEDQGHLAHVNHWIREQHATWKSGATPTTTVTVNGGAIDNVDFAVTSAVVLQLHDHAFPAIDTATTGHIYAINDDTTAYLRITDLSTIAADSTGASLRSNNTYYSLVIWGVVSEASGDSQLYLNEPSGFYITSLGATNDANGYSNYAIPSDFKGTGFLIARVTLRYQTADSGTLTEIETEDLRGLIPSTSPGGGGVSGGTEFSDNLFRIQNVSDITKQIAFDALAITTATTRTVTMSDEDIDFGLGGSFIRTTGNETIAGIKTFLSSPVVPAPTTDLQAATKKYTDDNLALKMALAGTEIVTGDKEFTGDIKFGNLLYNAALGTDDTYSGQGITGKNAGEAIAQWDQVYFDATAAEFLIADANVSGKWPAWGVAVTSGTDGNPIVVMTMGIVRNDAFDFTVNVPIYLSITAGESTETAPSTTGDCIQPVGRAITADIVYYDFNPMYGYGVSN